MDGFIDIPSVEPDIPTPNSILTGTPSQNFFGTLNVGNNRVKIDGQNGRQVINDGTRDIILIGYQKGGF